MERESSPRDALVKARERLGLTQPDIAAMFGVSQPTISHWETGDSTPHPSRWGEVAEFYGLSMRKVIAIFTVAA